MFSPPARFGRETAETVGARRFFGQTPADRGKDAPRGKEHDDEEENSLHESLTTSKLGGRNRVYATIRIRISNFEFRISNFPTTHQIHHQGTKDAKASQGRAEVAIAIDGNATDSRIR